MRLKYDSKKPRRVEIVVYQNDVLDVPTHIGEPLTRIAGFEATKEKRQADPIEQLEAVSDAIGAAEGDARDGLVNAVLALAAALSDAAEAVAETGVFDPGAHNVEEVLAHVAEHPTEREAVLAAETAGKARKTVIEALTE